MVELVIKIPNEIYNEVCWRGLSLCPNDETNLVKAIRNGTPLPKQLEQAEMIEKSENG